jgi:isoquinoline 1-oxidoreductase beta subunit
LFKAFRDAVAKPDVTVRGNGNMSTAQANAERFTKRCTVPFLAPLPLEPMNCPSAATGACELRHNSESACGNVAKVLGLPPAAVRVRIAFGGAFGRRYYIGYAVEAARCVKARSAPRTGDLEPRMTLYDFYRYRCSAAGKPRRRGKVTSWYGAGSSRPYLGREDAPNGTEIDAYDFPAGRSKTCASSTVSFRPRFQSDSGVLSRRQSLFFTSSFLDELAHLDWIHPVLSRFPRSTAQSSCATISLSMARLRRVVEGVAKLSGWTGARASKAGMGFAAGYTNTAFVAEVVQVSASERQPLSIRNIWAVVDCGRVINPLGAEAQVQGAIYEGLSSALYGEITVRDGVPEQTNFDRYRWLRIGEAPPIEVRFVGNEHPPRGLGEPALPPLAPALCNAIYAATGTRIRRLPISASMSV